MDFLTGPFAPPGATLAGNSSAAFASAGGAGSVINLDTNAYNLLWDIAFENAGYVGTSGFTINSANGRSITLGTLNFGGFSENGGIFVLNNFTGSNITENVAVPILLTNNFEAYLFANWAAPSRNDTLKISGNIVPTTTSNTILALGSSNGVFSGNILAGPATMTMQFDTDATWTMSGSNTYTGTTTVYNGTVALDYTTNNNSKLADGQL